MLKPNVSPLESNRCRIPKLRQNSHSNTNKEAESARKGSIPSVTRNETELTSNNYSRRQTSKTWKDGSHNCLFSSLCWLMRAWVRVTVILTRLLCPPSFQKLSKPAWALKSLGEGRGYGSLPIKRCDFSKICSLSWKGGCQLNKTKRPHNAY